MSLTEKSYWDGHYNASAAVKRPMVNPKHNYFVDELVRFITPYLPHVTSSRSVRLLELGCGNSKWLPYFAREWKYTVAGIDYSQSGCQMAKANLSAVGSTGDIYCLDFKQLDSRFEAQYDVVLSLGVVEHFEETADIVGRFAACLAPNGLLITVVPNMAGRMGWLQKLIDQQIYDLHVPLNKETLSAAHTANGLKIRTAGYLGFLLLGMINTSTLPFNKSLRVVVSCLHLLQLYVRRITHFRPQSREWSSFVAVVAQREDHIGHSSGDSRHERTFDDHKLASSD